jgi:isoleucyl-tRNA synthetase
VRRRAVRTVLDEIFSCLTAWLAPILCFTTEEAWLTRFPSERDSVHLRTYPTLPTAWRDEVVAERWERIRDLRRVVTGALELKRKEKVIGASLEAAPTLYLSSDEDAALFQKVNLAEITITSAASISRGDPPTDAFRLPDVPGVAASFAKADGDKCERCWMILPDVGKDTRHPTLCGRCVSAVEGRRS